MSRYVSDTAAGKSISAYVIMKGARHIATVQAHFGNGGRCLVNIWHATGNHEMQHGSASGYGYDKFTAALSGLHVDGHVLSDHSASQVKPPRGLRYFPENYKPKRGYQLANWGQYDPETGERLDACYWRDKAREMLGESALWEDVDTKSKELRAAADVVGGYGSCFRESGLKHLEALGYTVIQAI